MLSLAQRNLKDVLKVQMEIYHSYRNENLLDQSHLFIIHKKIFEKRNA